MRITRVDAFALRAPSPTSQTYWGSRAWASGSSPDTSTTEWHIHDIEAHHVVPEGYPPRWRMRASYSETVNTVIVRITMDNGLVGYGEAKAPVAPEATREIVRGLLAPVVLGADPLDIDVLWERMYSTMRLRAHTSGFLLEAISGVDIALWDLVGKILAVPAYKLLGGAFREKVIVYASGLPGLKDPHDTRARQHLQDEACALVIRGFRAIKLAIGFGVQADIATVEAVREAVGESVWLLCDAAGNYDLDQAGRLGRALEKRGVGWLEAPLPPEQVDGYAQLARALDLPIATDLVSTRYQVRDFLVRSAVDIVQPDVCRAGGLSECRRIAQLADVFGAGFAPHVSIGSAIHIAASAHLAVATPNFVIMEYWVGENPLGDAVLTEPLRLEHGFLHLPPRPGLGLNLNEEALLRYVV